MQSNHCLNCGQDLISRQNYCANCGQKADVKRITAKSLLHDFFQNFFNIDRGILHLLKGLATAPGTTALNYINGKRKQYFNPFAFLALAIAFSLFVNNWLNPFESLPTANYTDVASIPKELRPLANLANERAASLDRIVNDNMNIITVMITPYMAFALWAFFRRRKKNISEVALAYILFSAFGIICSTVIMYLPLIFFSSHSLYTVLTWLSLALQTAYYAWGMKIFFGYKTTASYFKVLGVFLLAGFIGFVLIFIFLFYYVYSGSWDLLSYFSQQKR